MKSVTQKEAKIKRQKLKNETVFAYGKIFGDFFLETAISDIHIINLVTKDCPSVLIKKLEWQK